MKNAADCGIATISVRLGFALNSGVFLRAKTRVRVLDFVVANDTQEQPRRADVDSASGTNKDMTWTTTVRFGRKGLGALGFAAALGVALAGSAAGQGVVKSVHDDWQIRCETPPGAQSEQCALFQSVVAEDRANVGITVLVLKTADQKSRLMRVQAPLGVLLPAGLGLKIDNADVGRAGFVRCLPRGCYAEVVMDDNLLKQLRSGTTATFFIFQTPEEGIGFPVSLKGFGPGYDKLP
jgi:invasion protein IalB